MRRIKIAAILVLASLGWMSSEIRAQGYWTNPMTGAPWPGPYGPINDGYPNGSSYVGPMVFPNATAPGAYRTGRFSQPAVRYVQQQPVQYVQQPAVTYVQQQPAQYVPQQPVQYVQQPPVRYYYVYPQAAAPQRQGRWRGFRNGPSSAPYVMPPMGFPPARLGIPAGMNVPPPML